MNEPSVREFHLSPTGQGRGLSCDETGAFVGGVPLLKRTNQEGIGWWKPRDIEKLSHELSKRYGLPVDLASKAAGLQSIARALNSGDTARAQLTALFLELPDLPDLTKCVSSDHALIRRAHALQESGLLAKSWEPDDHPRWPAGAPDSQGGEFAPKAGAGQRSTSDRNGQIQVAANSRRPLHSWDDFASENHATPIGGTPAPIIPDLAIGEPEFSELEAALEAELDSGFALRPGPFAKESVPASGPGVTRSEQETIDEIGAKRGCHTCGTQTSGMKDGHWIGDHQPPTRLNLFGRPQNLYPQCLRCSQIQGGTVTQVLRRLFGMGKLAGVAKGFEFMSTLECSVAAPNSLIFIEDPTHDYTVPSNTGGPLTYTSSCITVGTLESSRGDETIVRLGSDVGTPEGKMIFNGTLETPGRCVEVGTSWLERIFSMPVNDIVTRVRIWTNHPTEPDQIWIEVR
ncbi:MAG TPA: hypothetical protein VHY79_00880 [Rhizomicrobium sp.]|jgi:hypothetical protein|nr:hypothetical protein [Rhizomicrobium sp.]